ncbi:hypothetical protein K0M31_017644 [Melipona bicolor]|uniref:Uncharacterized protein n=1 Tax=Melipona bicolor TaxID=60889 RepID=A0AA40G5G2_9HYME|nr:hypothetical protein K0M31_017644 [Melipona bicolor]
MRRRQLFRTSARSFPRLGETAPRRSDEGNVPVSTPAPKLKPLCSYDEAYYDDGLVVVYRGLVLPGGTPETYLEMSGDANDDDDNDDDDDDVDDQRGTGAQECSIDEMKRVGNKGVPWMEKGKSD